MNGYFFSDVDDNVCIICCINNKQQINDFNLIDLSVIFDCFNVFINIEKNNKLLFIDKDV